MEDDPIYLSYSSACLRKSDVDCFDNYNILNDMAMSFYYEILNSKYIEFAKDFILLDPAATQAIIFEDNMEDMIEVFGPLMLNEKNIIFLPINDNTDRWQAGGGTHWALAVYQKSNNTFYYLDSMQSYIKNTGILLDKINLLITGQKSDKLEIVYDISEKYQNNTFDCGMFVLAYTEAVLDYCKNQNNFIDLLNKNSLITAFKAFDLSQNKIKNMRIDIKNNIENLKNNKLNIK